MLWRVSSKKHEITDEIRAKHALLIQKHAHKYPGKMPASYVNLLLGIAISSIVCVDNRTREHGQKLMRQRMAKASHKAQLAKGLKLCGPANEARRRNKELERKARARGVTMTQFRVGSANLDGI